MKRLFLLWPIATGRDINRVAYTNLFNFAWASFCLQLYTIIVILNLVLGDWLTALIWAIIIPFWIWSARWNLYKLLKARKDG